MLNIYQIYYKEEQISKLEKPFKPFFNSSETGKKWFEYFVFLNQFENRKDWSNRLTGFLSWKFGMKTAIKGEDFIHFINSNPGKDVYLVNPFYIESLMYKSQWEGAEYHHPGIMELTEYIFDKIGYDKKVLYKVQDLNEQLYANYWVGTEKFWIKYINYTKPIYEFIENNQDKWFQEKLMNRADNEIDAPYIPFIMERLFSLVLLNDTSIQFASYKYSEKTNQSKYKMVYDFFPILEEIKKSEVKNELTVEEKNFRTDFRNTNEFFDKEMKQVFKSRDEGKIFKVIKIFFGLKSIENFYKLYISAKELKPKLNFEIKFYLEFLLFWRIKLFIKFISPERIIVLVKIFIKKKLLSYFFRNK